MDIAGTVTAATATRDQIEYVLVRQFVHFFSTNQVAARRSMHELLTRSPAKAVEALYRVLIENSAGAGEPFVLSLLATDEARLTPLIALASSNFAAAVRIARGLTQVEPAVEAMLLRQVTREREPDSLLRVLSMIEEFSDCTRIAQQLQVLSHQPNERVRSKAARLLVRVSHATDRLIQMFSAPVPRVRANAAEGLFSVTLKPADIECLWRLADDGHHRPATTALAVLALNGERRASEKLIEMVTSSQETLQVAAAWAMGRVGDPAFLPVLQRLIREQSGNIRRMSIQSCALIRKNLGNSTVSVKSPIAQTPTEIQPSAPD